ncbi:zf-DHHC-domain-containing protein [Saccharata proteae CBS 121410]|uniref:Palmitoyltransferase n=1 Tax=Saccharata proteae CBS 121410 TaxID=1314787 RepID=A0A9P4M369_9PEZI|nr:zf-DHHC-domain-containing protein [Saccharata proteae CBS 121410]
MDETLRRILLLVAAISTFTFVALFGRLPIFRKTPVAFFHRVIWLHFPALLRYIDRLLTRGRITSAVSSTYNYLFFEKHPLVLIFFLGLLTTASALFLHAAYFSLPLYHRLFVPLILPLPYYFTYRCTQTRPNTVVSPANHSKQLQAYPYDFILYHPANACRTCLLAKPARSKHCSICKICVSRADHHCVWVNNCLGRENYRWFLLLLSSIMLVLLYGAYLANIVILYPQVYDRFSHYDHAFIPGLLSTWAPWVPRLKGFREDLNTVMVESIAVGGVSILGVGLLAALTWPLPAGLLAYHCYLIWAGMTTNENNKWADWRDQMRDGNVFVGSLRDADVARRMTIGARDAEKEVDEEEWPNKPRQVVVRTQDGEPPREIPRSLDGLVDRSSWERVWTLGEVENIYDLGFWENLREIMKG